MWPTLVWLAGRRGLQQVITLDETDFGIYRLPDGKRLDNLLSRSHAPASPPLS
jgi:hypothetical protein